ncbi:hypothetical protein K438DRAFT_1824037, partial [Mycena galopus ATCC 62051]
RPKNTCLLFWLAPANSTHISISIAHTGLRVCKGNMVARDFGTIYAVWYVHLHLIVSPAGYFGLIPLLSLTRTSV